MSRSPTADLIDTLWRGEAPPFDAMVEYTGSGSLAALWEAEAATATPRPEQMIRLLLMLGYRDEAAAACAVVTRAMRASAHGIERTLERVDAALKDPEPEALDDAIDGWHHALRDVMDDWGQYAESGGRAWDPYPVLRMGTAAIAAQVEPPSTERLLAYMANR